MTDTLEELTDSHLTDLLEQDYRRQLRWYPKPWQDTHGEALVGTLLDEAEDTDRFTMQPGEWRSFAAAGIASRLDRIIMRRVRDATATVMLTAGAGVSAAYFVISSWAPWGTGTSDAVPAFGPFYDAAPVLTVLWVAALASALVHRWWIGRVALLGSVLVAVFMRPVETLIAPAHFVSLDAGTLTLSATAALLAVLGTPYSRAPLVAASTGWAGLTCLAHAYLLLAGGELADRPTGILAAPERTSWMIALALGVALVFALARFRVQAFTIVLSVVPPTATLEASSITLWPIYPPATFLLILVPVVVGLIALVLTSRASSSYRTNSDVATNPQRRPSGARRRSITVAITAPLLVLIGTAGIFTASGLNWSNPTGVNWSRYWEVAASSPWADELEHPDASLRYRLPSGGSCTIRITITDLSPTPSPSLAAQAARDYLAAGTTSGTLLADADLKAVIKQNPSAQNLATNFWGVPIHYGHGTASYNPDVEYFEAVDAGLRQAVLETVTEAGKSPDDISYFSMQRCSGERV
jgi:hypothetical protein